MEMQLNFRSAHLYAINPAKKAGYNEIPEHLGPVILPNTGPECSSVKYYRKIYIETAREKIVIQRDWHTLMKDQAQNLKSREKYIEVRNQTYKEN